MLRHLMQGTSWIALRAPDDEGGSAQNLGDPHVDEVLESGPDETPPEPEAKADEPPAEPEAPAEPEKAAEPEPPKTDWRDKELARRKRRLDEEVTARQAAEEKARRLELLAESIRTQQQPPAEGENEPPKPRQSSGDRTYTRSELDAEVERIASEKAQHLDFQRTFDKSYQEAVKSYGKANMDASISRISEMGGLDVDHLNMVLATDHPEKVLYELGSKPEEFQRIMELPFNRRVVEFTKMGLKVEQPKKTPSRAPDPVEPIAGGGGPVDNRYSDKVSDNDWYAAEEKRAEARWKAKQKEWGR